MPTVSVDLSMSTVQGPNAAWVHLFYSLRLKLSSDQAKANMKATIFFDVCHLLPTAREGNVFYWRLSVILFTVSLMAIRSLLILVTARSVRILLECFLVPSSFLLVFLKSFSLSLLLSLGVNRSLEFIATNSAEPNRTNDFTLLTKSFKILC